jgi:hypothetical protein
VEEVDRGEDMNIPFVVNPDGQGHDDACWYAQVQELQKERDRLLVELHDLQEKYDSLKKQWDHWVADFTSRA